LALSKSDLPACLRCAVTRSASFISMSLAFICKAEGAVLHFNLIDEQQTYPASGARRELRVAHLIEQCVVQHLGQKRRYERGPAPFGPAHDDLVVPLGAVFHRCGLVVWVSGWYECGGHVRRGGQ
jgi:hypothetical protein